MRIHQIKVDFNVTEQIKRFVYLYLIEGSNCYLIDSGVSGCQQQIIDKMIQLGRELTDIKGIFLTHAHPDHIGTAAWLKECIDCKVYASQGEKPWIEDIDLQYKERPIPNFYPLAGRSVIIDQVVKDGDIIWFDEFYSIRVIGTPGHSIDEVSYRIGDNLFVGDSIPVIGDIPIYVDYLAFQQSLKKIKDIEDCLTFYPAWDHIYDKEEMVTKVDAALDMIEKIDEAVNKALEKTKDLEKITSIVCESLGLTGFLNNPLFKRTILSHINKE